jgi:hypothetical protein
MNISQMNAQTREQARQRCLQMGVPADELGGCIFDQGYLNIAPNVPPTPNIPGPTTTVLNKIERPALNNNAHTFSEGKYPNDRPQTIGSKPGGTIDKPQSVSKETKPFQPKEPTVIRAPREPEVSPAPRPTPTREREPRPSAPAQTPSRTNTPPPTAPKPSTPVAPKPSAPAVKSGKG